MPDQCSGAESELRDRLERSSRSGVMAETAALVARAVGQPLTALAVHAQSARELASASPLARDQIIQALDKVLEQAVRAGRALEQAQRLAGTDEGVYEMADVNALKTADERASGTTFSITQHHAADQPPR